jgi:hypothetical protein
MDKLFITMDLGNEAFADRPETEVGRIFQEFADRLRDGRARVGPGDSGLFHDHNSNRVGIWEVGR